MANKEVWWEVTNIWGGGKNRPWWFPGNIGIRPVSTYADKIIALFNQSLIGYWPMDEVSGSIAYDKSGNARNGIYSGVSLNNTLSRVGKPSPLFGTSNYLNVYSTSLRNAFNPSEGTVIVWVKLGNVGVWSDATIRNIAEFRADTNNRIYVRKSSTTSKIDFGIIWGSATVGGTVLVQPYTDWMRVGFTWSKSGDAIIGFVNGSQFYKGTGLGTWTGQLASTNAVFGAANNSGASFMTGWLSDGILLNRPATADEMIKDYTTTSIERISIIGDSIPNDPSEWPYRLQQLRQNFVIINHAVPGQSIMANMDAQVAACANDYANRIIMELGTNDDDAGDMGALQAKLESSIVTLRSTNPGAKIYYFGVLPRWTDTGGGTVVVKTHIRAAQIAACAAQGATYWDTFTTPWMTAAQTVDGLHPLTATHETIIGDNVSALM